MSATWEGTIRRDRLADQAYAVLRARVLESELAPGTRLSVPDLARQMGLSRSPVREAVQRLVSEGLAEERARHGAVVACADTAQILELYEIRELLEGLAARRVTERLGSGAAPATLLEELAARVEAHHRAVVADDIDRVVSADIAFHRAVLDGAESDELRRLAEPILSRVTLAMVSGDLHQWPVRAHAEHLAIVAAIRSGDPRAAEAAARHHIVCIRDRLMHLDRSRRHHGRDASD